MLLHHSSQTLKRNALSKQMNNPVINTVSKDTTAHSTAQFIPKVFKVAAERRARVSTFYINGDSFANGIRVSIIVGKDFKNLDALCDHLTERSKISNGVRYIFTLDGQRVTNLENIEHNHAYVISGVKQFQPLPYGKNDKLRPFNTLKNEYRIRPLSPRIKLTFPNYNYSTLTKINPTNQSKIVTVINGNDLSLRTRIFLNLSYSRSFEMMLKDIGQSVMLPNAKKMYTSDGQEVYMYCVKILYSLPI